jgi:O-antigen/teichoic acid export membrane protein
MSAQKLVSFSGIVVLAAMGLWSLRNLVIVGILASALAALAFLIVVPKASVWPESAAWTLRRLRMKSFFAGPALHTGTDAPGSSSPTGFLGFMVISTVVVMLTSQADVWMMGYFLKTSEVGAYCVAARFVLPLNIAIGALNSALWPRVSGATTNDELLRLLKNTMFWTALTAGFSVVYAACAPLLAVFLFGRVYAGSVLLGQLLCLRCCMSMFISPLGLVAYGFGIVRIAWMINLAQLVAVIGLNIVLLPRIGAMGSVLALLANEIIGMICLGLFLISRYRQITDARADGLRANV